MDRPITTLYMMMSVDGKISTGASDELDVDRDFPGIDGLKEGLRQYYAIEQTTDLWSFNTGRVQAKMGVNHKPLPEKSLRKKGSVPPSILREFMLPTGMPLPERRWRLWKPNTVFPLPSIAPSP